MNTLTIVLLCHPCCSRRRTDCPLFFWEKGSEKTGRTAGTD